MARSVRVNRPYQSVATIDMFLKYRVSRRNDWITRRILPAALAQSISSRFAADGAQ
jgi:hypothetical protein